jgi:lipase ATG15
VDQDDLVTEWRGDLESAVSFKLVTFPDQGNFAYVLIRGTINNWDMLTDAQLWSAAFFMQVLREVLPIGDMWTPAIDELIKVITTLESESILRVSFYRDTTRFVRFLQESVPETYAGVGVTGHR